MHVRIPKLVLLLLIFAAALTQASSAQAQWSMVTSPASSSPGATISVNWTAPNGSSATDWIGLYKVGGGAWYDYVYTNGATSGTANFSAPNDLGAYECRYFLNNSNNQVATSNQVTVANGTFTVSVSPESLVTGELTNATVTWSSSTARPATDWVALVKVGDPDTAFLSWAYTGGAQNGSVQLAMPTTPATYRVKYFLKNSFSVGASGNSVLVVPDLPEPTLFVTPTLVEIGDQGSIDLFFTAPRDRRNDDWIAMYEVGADPGEEIWWTYTNGEAGGSFSFPVPEVTGEYEFRYHTHNPFSLLAVSDTIYAVPPAGVFSLVATLSAEPGTAIPSIRLQWSVPAGRPNLDWIGLYPVGTNDRTGFIKYFYTRGLATGDVHIPRPAAGTYELRYFANNGWAKIATSNQIEVP